MGTSGSESCEGCLQTQFKHFPPQLALKLSLVRLQSFRTSKEVYELKIQIEKIAQNAVLKVAFFFVEPVA